MVTINEESVFEPDVSDRTFDDMAAPRRSVPLGRQIARGFFVTTALLDKCDDAALQLLGVGQCASILEVYKRRLFLCTRSADEPTKLDHLTRWPSLS